MEVGRGGSNENRMGRKGDSSGGSRQRNKSSLRIKGWRSMVRGGESETSDVLQG